MAFYDPFSFASSTDLAPIYEDADGLLSWSFEHFPMDDPLIVDPVPMYQPNLVETHVPLTPSSSALLTDSFHFINPTNQYMPFMDKQWEQPRSFIKPELSLPAAATNSYNQPTQGNATYSNFQPTQAPSAPVFVPTAQHQHQQHQHQQHQQHQQQIMADEESSESILDFALALSPAEPLPPVERRQPVAPVHHQMNGSFHHYHHYSAPTPAPVCSQPPMMYHGQPQSPLKIKRSHRVVEDEDEDADFSALESEPIEFGDGEEDPTGGFKLPASKSPIMEAMVVCALNGWGIDIITNNRPTSTTPAEVVFRVTDFNRYYKISRTICSKQRPTDDLGSRIKSLRRWFVNFPKKKDRCENSFNLIVKPTIAKKVNEIIERNSKSLGLTKRRRRQ